MKDSQASLACVAPSSYEALLTHRLEAVGFSVRFFPRDGVTSTNGRSGRRFDPYDLKRIAHEMSSQEGGIILVVP